MTILILKSTATDRTLTIYPSTPIDTTMIAEQLGLENDDEEVIVRVSFKEKP